MMNAARTHPGPESLFYRGGEAAQPRVIYPGGVDCRLSQDRLPLVKNPQGSPTIFSVVDSPTRVDRRRSMAYNSEAELSQDREIYSCEITSSQRTPPCVGERLISSTILHEEVLTNYTPSQETTRFVEIPVREEVIRTVPRREIFHIRKHVPQYSTSWSNIIEVDGRSESGDRFVEEEIVVTDEDTRACSKRAPPLMPSYQQNQSRPPVFKVPPQKQQASVHSGTLPVPRITSRCSNTDVCDCHHGCGCCCHLRCRRNCACQHDAICSYCCKSNTDYASVSNQQPTFLTCPSRASVQTCLSSESCPGQTAQCVQTSTWPNRLGGTASVWKSPPQTQVRHSWGEAPAPVMVAAPWANTNQSGQVLTYSNPIPQIATQDVAEPQITGGRNSRPLMLDKPSAKDMCNTSTIATTYALPSESGFESYPNNSQSSPIGGVCDHSIVTPLGEARIEVPALKGVIKQLSPGLTYDAQTSTRCATDCRYEESDVYQIPQQKTDILIPRYIDQPVVVAQSLHPIIRESESEVLEVEMREFNPYLIPVDVIVPRPIARQLKATEMKSYHQVVDVPPAHYEELVAQVSAKPRSPWQTGFDGYTNFAARTS